MKDNNFIVAITGKSASGKSSIEQILANQYGYKRVVSTTTRPIRSNESNHVDYHFVSEDEFIELIEKDKLIEYRYYDTIENGKNSRWHYGITKDEIDLDKYSYVCVVDLQGLHDLEVAFNNRVISFYIDTPEEIRKIRAIARDRYFEELEWNRRAKDDDIKFNEAEVKVDIVVNNDDFSECLSKVLYWIDYIKKSRTFFRQYASW